LLHLILGGSAIALVAACSSGASDGESATASEAFQGPSCNVQQTPSGARVSSCSAQFVPPANGVPGHTQEAETIGITCARPPERIEVYAAGAWRPVTVFRPNLSYPTSEPGVYVIGAQDYTNDALQGGAVGSEVAVRACASPNDDSCDAPVAVVVTPCCQPRTACEVGACGQSPDGCGGTLSCPSSCPSGETCKAGYCQAPPTCGSPRECCMQNDSCNWVGGRCHCSP
jgi:hypothetical protein